MSQPMTRKWVQIAGGVFCCLAITFIVLRASSYRELAPGGSVIQHHVGYALSEADDRTEDEITAAADLPSSETDREPAADSAINVMNGFVVLDDTTKDILAKSIQEIAESFKTERPDIDGLRNLVHTLGQKARVIDGSVSKDDYGRISG